MKENYLYLLIIGFAFLILGFISSLCFLITSNYVYIIGWVASTLLAGIIHGFLIFNNDEVIEYYELV